MPTKKRPATKVSKNQKLRRVNLLSSTLELKKTHRTSWPGYSPVIGLSVIVVVALIVGAGLYYLSSKTKSTNTNSTVGLETNKNTNANANLNINNNANTVACTMEAKLCSDGTYVSRIPPDCQFAACSGETNMNLNSNANANINGNTNTAGWQTYTNNEIGISFKYPQEFGVVTFTWQPSETGQEFNGTFDHNPRLMFSGMTDDFSAGRDGGVLDTRGFLEQNSKYYFTFVADKPALDYPVEPVKILTGATSQKILLLDQNSFINDRGITDGPTFAASIGANALAGLMNTGQATYPGIVFVDKDMTTFTQTQFESLLKTVTVTK